MTKSPKTDSGTTDADVPCTITDVHRYWSSINLCKEQPITVRVRQSQHLFVRVVEWAPVLLFRTVPGSLPSPSPSLLFSYPDGYDACSIYLLSSAHAHTQSRRHFFCRFIILADFLGAYL